MDTDIQPADRAVLQVVPDQIATPDTMHEALVRTGRTVLTRCDLYQAMGALAAARRSVPIEAVFISAATISHDDAEFFEIATRAFSGLAIYVYGESSSQADHIIQQSAAARIDAESIGALFNEASRTPPKTDSLAEVPLAKTDAEAVTVLQSESAPDAPSELEERLLRSLEHDDASPEDTSVEHSPEHPADPHPSKDSDPVHVVNVDLGALTHAAETPNESDHYEDRPLVPWNPSLARPARTPPRRDGVLEVVEDADDEDSTDDEYARRSDEADADQPLLTREELDALLQEEHDSSGGLEHQI